MLGGALQSVEMGNGIFAAIISVAGISDISLVILQPVGHSALIFLHFSGNQSHISAVIHIMVPIILQGKLGLLILSVNHQTRSVTIESVHHVSLTVLSGLVEVIIQYGLHIEG